MAHTCFPLSWMKKKIGKREKEQKAKEHRRRPRQYFDFRRVHFFVHVELGGQKGQKGFEVVCVWQQITATKSRWRLSERYPRKDFVAIRRFHGKKIRNLTWNVFNELFHFAVSFEPSHREWLYFIWYIPRLFFLFRLTRCPKLENINTNFGRKFSVALFGVSMELISLFFISVSLLFCCCGCPTFLCILFSNVLIKWGWESIEPGKFDRG